MLVKHEIPTVVCYRRDVPDGIAWIDPDNEQIMRLGVTHLVERGHTRIAHLTEVDQSLFDTVERRRYFAEAVCSYGLHECADWIVPGRYFHITADTVATILNLGATAVVCHNDLLAENLMNAMNKLGLKVPEDLSIIGVDGLTAEALDLTSVEFSFEDVGAHAVEALINCVKGKTASECHTVIQVHLQARGSVRDLRVSHNG